MGASADVFCTWMYMCVCVCTCVAIVADEGVLRAPFPMITVPSFGIAKQCLARNYKRPVSVGSIDSCGYCSITLVSRIRPCRTGNSLTKVRRYAM